MQTGVLKMNQIENFELEPSAVKCSFCGKYSHTIDDYKLCCSEENEPVKEDIVEDITKYAGDYEAGY